MSLDPTTVLVVDDNDVDVEGLRRGLSRHEFSHRLITTDDGLIALDLLRSDELARSAPVLVLLDLNMPAMSGVEFLRELRKDPAIRDTIVFVLTTSNRPEDIASTYALHISGYILKSKVGEHYQHLVDLLRVFHDLVEFAPRRSS